MGGDPIKFKLIPVKEKPRFKANPRARGPYGSEKRRR